MSQRDVPPTAGIGGGDGGLEGGLARNVTEDRRAGEHPPAQAYQFGALGLVGLPLRADTEIVGTVPQMACCLVRMERAAQALQAELGPNFPDPVLNVSPTVVAAAYLQGADRGCGWQVGPQGLLAAAQRCAPVSNSVSSSIPKE